MSGSVTHPRKRRARWRSRRFRAFECGTCGDPIHASRFTPCPHRTKYNRARQPKTEDGS